MRGPKQAGDYSDRDIDCQQDMAEGFTDRFDRELLSGNGRPTAIREGLRATQQVEWNDVVTDAVNAGWSEQEAQTALSIVVDGILRGEAGTDPDE
ncbi:hypothetical protein ABE527_02200 [Brucella sp. TWI432]